MNGKRWTVHDRYGNEMYITDERWEHIIEPINHTEMVDYEKHLQGAIRWGNRKQDPMNPRKFRYTKAFGDLAEDNTHIVVIVLFRFRESRGGEPLSNNYIVTAYQKEIG